MVDPLGIAGALASITGLGINLFQYLSGRKKRRQQATLEHYLEWLKRNRHRDILTALQQSAQARQEIGEFFAELQEKNAAGFGRVLKELEKLSKSVDEMPGDVVVALRAERERVRSEEDKKYEQLYREAVSGKLDEMELFGIDPRIDAAAKKQRLMIAYLTLNLTNERGAEQAPRPFEALLGNMGSGRRNKVLISGDAGSGKTTLLKWAAIRSARALVTKTTELQRYYGEHTQDRTVSVPEESEPSEHKALRFHDVPLDSVRSLYFSGHAQIPAWVLKTPFFIPLRKCTAGKFPTCAEFPSLVNASLRGPPDNWVESILQEGRGLVLIDGVDEVPPRWRRSINRGITDFLNLYGDKGSLFVVTSRPLMEDPPWIAEHRFQEARIAPMSEPDRNELIRLWHEAVAGQLREYNRDKEAAGLPAKSERLKHDLARNPAVAQVAANPLMCAMLCALCGQLDYKLPDSQYEIVEQLCKVLLQSREEHTPDLDLADFPPAYRRLKYPQRKAILARLAYDMVRGGLSAAPRQALIAKADDALAAFSDRDAGDGAVVADTLVERSGMLSKLADDDVDFIHNTFKEFLASDRFVAEGRSKELAGKCLQAGYKNVCLFAAAAERAERFVDDLLKKVLPPDSPPGAPPRKGRRRQAQTIAPEVHERRLLAIRMRQVAVLPDAQLAQRVDGLRKDMFPPRTLADAEVLAALGDQVVDELAYRPSLRLRQKVRCVRALRLIGKGAGETLQRYAQTAKPKENALLGELVQAMNPLKIPEILHRVTSESPPDVSRFDDKWLPISFRKQIRDLTPLAGLTALTSLYLVSTQVSDLTPLAGLTALTTLDLRDTQVSDLTPLAGLTALTTLDLMVTLVSDLTPLAEMTALTTLNLWSTLVLDLTPLAGLTALTTLNLWSTRVSDPTPLAGLTNLTEYIGPPIPGHPRFGP